MKLSMELLQERLSEALGAELVYGRGSEALLDRPILYVGDGSLEQGKLYVTRTDFLPDNPPQHGASVICVGDTVPEVWRTGKSKVMTLGKSVDIFAAFREVSMVFDAFDAWERTLRDELEREEEFDYRAVARCGAEMLDNTIGMSDQNLRIMFTVEPTRTDENEIAIVLSEGRYEDILIETGKQIGAVSITERELRKPYVSSFSAGGASTYCCNIHPFDRFVGCCFIYPSTHPFRAGDYLIADVFFKYFSLAFTKHLRTHASTDRMEEKAMRSLLAGSPLSRMEKDILSLESGEKWAFFQLVPGEVRATMLPDYLNAAVYSLLAGSVFSTVIDDTVEGMLKIKTDKPVPESPEAKTLVNLVESTGYFAGISNMFTDLAKVPIHRMQAAYTLRASAKESPRKHVRHFKRYTLDYMLFSCTSNIPLESLFSEQLQNLMDYDAEHGTELVRTLQCYLENESRMSETSRQLYLHRSSLTKRLDRIRKILETDLEDPRLNLYYRICLETLRRQT